MKIGKERLRETLADVLGEHLEGSVGEEAREEIVEEIFRRIEDYDEDPLEQADG